MLFRSEAIARLAGEESRALQRVNLIPDHPVPVGHAMSATDLTFAFVAPPGLGYVIDLLAAVPSAAPAGAGAVASVEAAARPLSFS